MDWIKKLKEYAPDIVTAVLTGGATLPQLALKAVADATGNEVNTQDDLQRAVESATPEMMLKITQANNQFKIRMRELDNEIVLSELGDTQDARKNHKHSNMPAVICIGLSVVVTLISVALIFEPIPEGNSQMINMLIGQIVAAWMTSIAYWVGTTRSSANKDRK
jgi:heme/copper-type cytochrome/quinol oxidase subunit 4